MSENEKKLMLDVFGAQIYGSKSKKRANGFIV